MPVQDLMIALQANHNLSTVVDDLYALTLSKLISTSFYLGKVNVLMSHQIFIIMFSNLFLRLPYVAAREGHMVNILSMVHIRYYTPLTAAVFTVSYTFSISCIKELKNMETITSVSSFVMYSFYSRAYTGKPWLCVPSISIVNVLKTLFLLSLHPSELHLHMYMNGQLHLNSTHPCGRFKKHFTQGECEFQVDKVIWHFLIKYLLPLW